MQTTDLRDRDDGRSSRVDHPPAIRRVLVQSKMRPGPVIVGKLRPEDAPKMRLVQDDDVVETLSSDRADHALDERILPGTRRRGHDLGDGHARHAALAQRQILQDQFSMSTNSQRQRPTDAVVDPYHTPVPITPIPFAQLKRASTAIS